MKRTMVAYAVVVTAIVAWMSLPRAGDTRPSSKDAKAMTWSEVKDDITVPAKPRGIWTWAFDYVKGPALIKIEASGTWSYSGARQCEPDGDLNSLVSKRDTILPEAPIGSLLVKIGGSTAGVSDGVVRVAGSSAVVHLDDKAIGPVFLTINDELTGMSDNAGEVKVKLSIRQLTTASEPGS